MGFKKCMFLLVITTFVIKLVACLCLKVLVKKFQ